MPVVLVLLAAAAVAAGGDPPPVRDVERRLEELNGRLGEERERLVLATVAIGGIAQSLDRYAPSSREAAETRALIVSLLSERRAETAALELKTALLAEQLQRYKETGVFSPTPSAEEARLRALIDKPWDEWKGRKPVASLSLDLAILQKELRRWRGEEALPPARKPAARPPVRPEGDGGGFVRDRGKGRPASDPIPELMAQLSSDQAGRRALAADQLGSRGAAAAPAVPALRRALSDPDGRVRASAALALGAVGKVPADALAEIRRALNDKDPEVRFSARLALRRLDSAP